MNGVRIAGRTGLTFGILVQDFILRLVLMRLIMIDCQEGQVYRVARISRSSRYLSVRWRVCVETCAEFRLLNVTITGLQAYVDASSR
jgi:hypothetical protein